MLQIMRSARAIGPGIRMEHMAGPNEPLLWAADIVCGAVTQREQNVSEYFDEIASLANLHLL